MPSITGRGTGWIKNDTPPTRLFSAHPAAVAAVPPRAFLMVPPSLDQGALGSCTANATAMGVAILSATSGDQVWVSRLMVYLEARKLLGAQYVGQDSGAMPDDALAVIHAGKAGPESLWPYAITKFTLTPPPLAYAAAQAHAVEFHSISSSAVNGVAEAKQAIAAGFPVNFGFSLRENATGMEIDNLGPDGTYPWDSGDHLTNEGHDTLIVGYDDARQAFCVVNSWGQAWGVGIPGQPDRGRGCFWMPYAMFASSDVDDRSAMTNWS